MDERLEELKELRERLFGYDISALLLFEHFCLETFWEAEDDSIRQSAEELLDETLNIANEFIDKGDKTGIPQYALYLGFLAKCKYAANIGDEEYFYKYADVAKDYLEESLDLGLCFAYRDLGRNLFMGDSLWDRDEEKGLELLKKALEIQPIPEIGIQANVIADEIKTCYENCLEIYSNSQNQKATENENVKKFLNKVKPFSKVYIIVGLIAFFGYSLLSLIIRTYFGLQSAYDISINENWLLGIGVTLILNFSVIPLLMTAYFYRQNNGKQSKFLVILYVLFLLGCFIDGLLPYIVGNSLSKINFVNTFLFPIIFIVLHRLLSLLIYVGLKGKEGQEDYRIYYMLVLLAPFLSIIFLIAVIFWFFQGVSAGNNNEYQSSDEKRSSDLKEEIRKQLGVGLGLRRIAVYYDKGWKAVDYWDKSYELKEVSGDDWRNTYLQDTNGKTYILSTNCPDKESVYYFN
ncbi:MAG: hypothetical protein E7348_04635 [Clostridiales bacterium]|nr:hypothetical protein [Clostridiales bacterium]